MELYKKIEKSGKLKGRSITIKTSLVLHVASRLNKRPINLNNLNSLTQSTKKELRRAYKAVVELIPTNKTSLKPTECVKEICSKIENSHRIEHAAYEVAENI